MHLPWPFNEIWAYLESLWHDIWGEFNWLWGAIDSLMGGVQGAVHNWIRDWTGIRINDLWSWIRPHIDAARDTLNSWIQGAIDSAKWHLDALIANTRAGIDNVWSWVNDSARWVWDQVRPHVDSARDFLHDRLIDLQNFLDNTRNFLGTKADELWAEVVRLWEEYNTIVFEMDQAALERENSLTVTTNNIIQGGAEAVNLMTGFVQENLINPLETYLASIPRDIAAFFTDLLRGFWTTLQEWISGAMTWWGETAWPTIENALGGLRDWLMARLGDLGGRLLAAITQGSPATPEQAMGRVNDVLALGGIAVGSLGAMSAAAELMHPLKQIGMGRLAAMLWDATGYQSVIGPIMSTLVTANITTPLRYNVNRQFRPWLPDRGDLMMAMSRGRVDPDDWWGMMAYHGYGDNLRPFFENLAHTVPPIPDLGMMFAKKEIDAATFDRWMGLHGIGPEYTEVYHRHIWMDPRLSEMVRIAQFYRPPATPDPEASAWLQRAGITPDDPADWWWWYKTAKAGYERVDIPILVAVAKIAVARREQTLYFDAARRLRRDGYISQERLLALVEDGWRPRPPIDFRADATDLDLEYDVKAEVSSTVLIAYTRRAISEAECLGFLTDLGMDLPRARLSILRSKLGLLPRGRLALAAEVDDGLTWGDSD